MEVIGSADISERLITWVYVSELPNPGPWLDGGELVLTLGLWLRNGSCTADLYVQRLVESGAAALAVLAAPQTADLATYPEVPPELVAAANCHGLPLLRVPGEVTFLTVTKTIAYALASQSLARLSETLDAQELLARDAVGRGGLAGMTARLATLLNAWILVIGPTGTILDSTPNAPLDRVEELLSGVRASLSARGPNVLPLLSATESVLAYRLQAGDRHCGSLIIGRQVPPTATQRRVINLASVIMTLILDREQGELDLSQRLRTKYAQALLRSDNRTAELLAALIGIAVPTGPVFVLAAGSRVAGDQPRQRAWLALRESLGTAVVAADNESQVAVLDAPAGAGLDLVKPIVSDVPDLVIGLAGPVDPQDLGLAQRQAMSALAEAMRTDCQVIDSNRPAPKRLLDVLPRAAARAFAAEALGPLLEYDRTHRGDLILTLRCWLEHSGQWEPTSAAMGVHRHTLRNRIGRVEEVLGVRLSSADTRMELWAALQLRHDEV
ncbi:MAG TPA: PucR family transcriptional regulator [Mycobacteriales bacterium]|nr:PucR family transcriptional regulator [Mycobacteriales bacterium]